MEHSRKSFALRSTEFASVTVAIVVLAACSSGAMPALSGVAAAKKASVLQPHADTANCPARVVYVVSSYEASVDVYDAAQLRAQPCGRITGFASAQGLFVDSSANLWVADAIAQHVYEFAPGVSGPLLTLNDPDGEPASIAIDEKNGTVYVTDYQNSADSTTLVEVYAKGSTLPTNSLGDPAGRNGAFDAVDDRGNLYVTFMTQSNTAQVDRWTGGTGTPTNLGLKLVSAGAIITTRSGALAVCDPFAYRCGIFERGSSKMSHVFGHMARGNDAGIVPDKRNFLHPNALALDRAERRAFVSANSLSLWRYPGPLNRPNHRPRIEIDIAGGAGNGIAVNPASRPGEPF